jgi:hypothetical protein
MENTEEKKITGLDILNDPKISVEKKAEIISHDCPPDGMLRCKKITCNKCWLAWLSGKSKAEK